LGPGDPKVALVLNNMAGCLRRLNRLEEAETLAIQALGILETANHDEQYVAMETLARIKGERGENLEADRLFHTATDMLKKAVGPTHLNVADYLEHHAEVAEKLGRAGEAETMLHAATQIRQALA
jgi:hypothetical protein